MKNTTLATAIARTAIDQGATTDYVCQHGDFEALAEDLGRAPTAGECDELARDVQEIIRKMSDDSPAATQNLPVYAIDCRHASGSSHWDREPGGETYATEAEAEAAIETLEETDEDGSALEYRVVRA